MGRHGRAAIVDTGTMGLMIAPGGLGLYPTPDETAEDKARWLDRSWTLFRELSWDDRLFGRMPYDAEIGSKPAIDPRTGTRRGRRARV